MHRRHTHDAENAASIWNPNHAGMVGQSIYSFHQAIETSEE